MDIFVNGQPQVLGDAKDLSALLNALGLEGRIAVELNGEVIPRSQHAQTVLQAGDRVEIIRAVGGG